MNDWTQGPARWIAAVVLGGASVAGMTWSIATHRPVEPIRHVAEPVGDVVAADPPRAQRPSTPATSVRTANPIPTGRIDLNTATAAELQLLKGIGPTLAARIIEDRETNGPFESVDALDRVRGIGPRTIENIADMATVGD